MLTKEDIKKEIERLMVHFPNYNPVLEGDINVVSEFYDEFKDISPGAFREALHNLTIEPGRKFVPSTGEIKHAVNELKYKGTSEIERDLLRRGYTSASEL